VHAPESHRQIGRVVDLEPRLGQAARVGDAVGGPQVVSDVALAMVHAIACFKVRQTEAGQNVATANDEQPQVDDVKEE